MEDGRGCPNDAWSEPHVKIINAAKRGRGLRLTAAEVMALARDEAVMAAACNMVFLDCEEWGSDDEHDFRCLHNPPRRYKPVPPSRGRLKP